ncbi:MAG: MATE family efflux transporter [Gammaproteobacteria bacterium]|nr:MATE family efflux transporter [Gammaproteobacteria bacterium]
MDNGISKKENLLDKITWQFSQVFSISEFGHLSKIAWPLILSSLVTMSVSITDVLMIGQLGTVQLAAAAAASDYYSIFYYLAAGVAAAISPLIAQARGRKDFRIVKTIWVQGLIVTLLMGIPAALAIYNAPMALTLIGVDQAIVQTGTPYAHMMAIAVFPMLCLSVMHYFLSALNRTRIILYITAASLPVNIIGNYAFLYGNWGVPEMGVAGAGVASIITGSLMFFSLLIYVLKQQCTRKYFYFPVQNSKSAEIRNSVFVLGLPIGISHFGEMGVFLFATVSMGIFGAEVLAAHTIALRMAGVFYAVPIAYAQAAMVRIGLLAGQKNIRLLTTAIKTAISFSLMAGLLLMSVLIMTRYQLPGLFIEPQKMTDIVNQQAALFILLLALMQPSMIVGTVGAGILRGFKDSAKPMVYSLVSYWGCGFVGALMLAFWLDLQGLGIWVGLLAATISFAVLVVKRIVDMRDVPLAQHTTLKAS